MRALYDTIGQVYHDCRARDAWIARNAALLDTTEMEYAYRLVIAEL